MTVLFTLTALACFALALYLDALTAERDAWKAQARYAMDELNAYRYAMDGARYAMDALIEDAELRAVIMGAWSDGATRTHDAWVAFCTEWNTDDK